MAKKKEDKKTYVYFLPNIANASLPKYWKDVLSKEERSRVKKFVNKTAADEYIISRLLLRHVLGSFIGLSPKEVKFNIGKNGKPFLLKTGKFKKVFFNISHSSGAVVVALSFDGELGIDIEKEHPVRNLETVIDHFFSEEEKAFLFTLNNEDLLKHFFSTWVRKEAILKAIGTGIGYYLDKLDVPTQIDFSETTIDVSEYFPLRPTWTIKDIPLDYPLHAALCLEGGAFTVIFCTVNMEDLFKAYYSFSSSSSSSGSIPPMRLK